MSGNDSRLWVERGGIHENQAFYSVEYAFDDRDEVRNIIRKVDVYQRWVRQLYDELRAGRPGNPLPEELRTNAKPQKKGG